jgi:MFS family permease
VRRVSQKTILVIAMCASTVEMSLLAAAPYLSATAAYAAVSVGALGSMAFPVISALKSVNSNESEQGKVQGALFGARALAQGLGPLLFSWLFKYYTRAPRNFPSAPLVGLTLLMALGTAVAALLHIPPADASGDSATATRRVTAGVDVACEVAPLISHTAVLSSRLSSGSGLLPHPSPQLSIVSRHDEETVGEVDGGLASGGGSGGSSALPEGVGGEAHFGNVSHRGPSIELPRTLHQH